jgi:hypothetical protein
MRTWNWPYYHLFLMTLCNYDLMLHILLDSLYYIIGRVKTLLNPVL